MERSKAELNFTLNITPDQFNKMNDEQKKHFFREYLQQVQSLMMGAIVAGRDDLDFTVRINSNLLDSISIPEEASKLMTEKRMTITVVFIGNGEGKFFN